MDKKRFPAKVVYALVGALLGLGSPLGSLLFRGVMAGQSGTVWLRHEWEANLAFYLYMLIMTPIVFSLFGCFLGVLKDQNVSQNRRLEHLNDLLRNETMMDGMTGLYNHKHMLVEIRREVDRARRYRRPLSGMMIDIDDFKRINDEYGHIVGDHVIKETAYVLDSMIRTIDIVGRFGGDEFFVILPECPPESTESVAERIQSYVLGHDYKAGHVRLAVTLSIGWCGYKSLEGIGWKTFIEVADQALLRAKRLGKNRIMPRGVARDGARAIVHVEG